jgi:hypothetical protein
LYDAPTVDFPPHDRSSPYTGPLFVPILSAGGLTIMLFGNPNRRASGAGLTNGHAGSTATDPFDRLPADGDPRDLGRAAAMAKRARERPELQRIKAELSCPPPWDIAQLSYLLDPPRFTVWVYDLAGYWPCPICQSHEHFPGTGHSRVHVFHCVTCDTETFVHARIPVIDCPRHGRQEVTIPWMAEHEKWSYVRTLSLEEEADQRYTT